jgi:hypothetical protein
MVGGIVIAKRNDKTHLRSAPQRKVKNSWSAPQVLHRERFKKVNQFCGLFKDTLIPQIWNYEAVYMTGYSLFLKANMGAFGPDGTLEDPKLIQLSTGKLTFPPDMQVRRSELNPYAIEVNWTREMKCGGNRYVDELIVISTADGQYSEITGTGLVRMNHQGTFELPIFPKPAANGPQYIYLMFASKDRRDYSKSVCYEV